MSFESLGLPRLYVLRKLNPVEPPWYGPVCPVVWEGRRREAPPYPDQWLEGDLSTDLGLTTMASDF